MRTVDTLTQRACGVCGRALCPISRGWRLLGLVACSRPAPPRASRTTGCASRRSAAASAAKAAHHWSGARARCVAPRMVWGEETHLCARWRANLRAGGLDRGLDRAGSVGADTCADRLVVDRLLGHWGHRHLPARARNVAVPGSTNTGTEAPTEQGEAAVSASASMGSSATCKECGGNGTSLAASPSSSSVFLAKIGPHENRRRKVSIYGWLLLFYGWEGGQAHGGRLLAARQASSQCYMWEAHAVG